jgi:TetR/AcrR family transcriptional regulator
MSPVSPNIPAPAHPRMAAEDRRRQLIETAIDLFSQKGFAGTTTREIAAAAGVTEAIIFRHFATKQDLYQAILTYKCDAGMKPWMEELNAIMDADDDEGLIRSLVTHMLAFHREDPRFHRLMLHAALEGHEIAIIHHNQVKMPMGAKLMDYIARRQAAGAIRPADPGSVVLAIAGIPQFYALQKYVYQSADFQFADDQVIETFVQILSTGLLTGTTTKEGIKQ